jgi:hypothetical protein
VLSNEVSVYRGARSPARSGLSYSEFRFKSSVDFYMINLTAEGAWGDSKKLFAVANIRSIVRANHYVARAVPGQYLSAFAAATRVAIWILTQLLRCPVSQEKAQFVVVAGPRVLHEVKIVPAISHKEFENVRKVPPSCPLQILKTPTS